MIRPIKHIFFIVLLFLATAGAVDAASLSLSPDTGVYQAGSTFTARVQVQTGGDPVNAAEGTISFNPNELSVVSVSRSSSIFNLWVAEPTFSNSAGTITFSGGVPTGYSGSVGTVLTVTFRTKGAGAPRVSFTNGSVLANDGKGTNVLTAMRGGTYTVQAASAAPEPEIIEYIAPANTPAAPQVTSATHPDPAGWYAADSATLNWTVPADVTAMRTLLDRNPTTVPTKVYDTPIRSITLDELPEGVSYFHIQFRNADGWGRVSHVRLGVDTVAPSKFTIALPENADLSAPEQNLLLQLTEDTSGIARYTVKLDDAEPYEYIDTTASGTLPLTELAPGYHSVIVEAFDKAGNSVIATFSFTIEAFEPPVFTEIPTEMSGDVIPVIIGETRPGALVTVFFNRLGSEANEYEVTADDTGRFTFVPDGQLYSGVYEVAASAVDQYGAHSARSSVHRIAVQEPGYIRLGSQMVDVMSILVPLLLLVFFLVLGLWYVWFWFRRFRGTVAVESIEALDILHREFSTLQSKLREQESVLQESRKTKKLTKAEAEMIEVFDRALQTSQRAVEKEIEDVTRLTSKE